MFEKEFYDRLTFGEVQILMNVRNGLITEVKVFTDALDTEFPTELEGLLKGRRYDGGDILDALKRSGDERMEEIWGMIESTL